MAMTLHALLPGTYLEGRTETQALGWFEIVETRSVYLPNTVTIKKATNASEISFIPQISTASSTAKSSQIASECFLFRISNNLSFPFCHSVAA